MAETGTDIENILREWAPVSDFLNNIPAKSHNGIFTHDVYLTCVDILPEYIAVGTNVGLVYWYDRKSKELQRLRCENANARVTAIKVISTVDYMVACGDCDGQISIFQIPKRHPDGIPESLRPKSKQVERYTVSELHTSQVTSLEWSKNGMKLFSGDKNGLVVLTEIDFYMHLSKSVDIFNEAFEVIQISYCQQHLLISTTYRTIVCKKEEKWNVCQVGKKDRKTLGRLGAIFWRNSLKPKDLMIYCTRPGLRIWVSDVSGIVQRTLLFKDLLSKECFEVPLINPMTGYAKKLKPSKEATFGVLLPFADNLLVTYSSDIIYILDPNKLLVMATISHLRTILSVAVHKDELFVLEGERSLIRISFKPEPYDNGGRGSIPTASTFLPLANSIKDLTNKLQTTSIMSALPPFFELNTTYTNIESTDSSTIVNAEEAEELPPLKKLHGNLSLKITTSSRRWSSISNGDIYIGMECKDVQKDDRKWETFAKISEEDFDDHILFKHRRRKKLKTAENIMQASTTSSSSSDTNQPCLLNISTITNMNVPDLRSPASILHDIENKEKILADILNLDKINFSTFENDSSKGPHVLAVPNPTLTTATLDGIQPLLTARQNSIHPSPKTNGFSTQDYKNSSCESLTNATLPLNNTTTNYKNEEDNSNDTRALPLSYGPPSGSSNPNSIEPPACLAVPNVWRLQEITINSDLNETSDSSLCDWEII